MKKIKQKMSKITKIFLVLAMLFSNLSCLSTVFAYESEETNQSNITLELDKENNQIKITYAYEEENEENNSEVPSEESTPSVGTENDDMNETIPTGENEDETVPGEENTDVKPSTETVPMEETEEKPETKLYVQIIEQYTYLDETKDEANKEIQVPVSSLKEGYTETLQLSEGIVFDGTYNIKVSIGNYNEEEFNLLDSNECNEDYSFEKGFSYKIIADNNELEKENDAYNLPEDVSQFQIVSKLNMGGIIPTATYLIGEEEYTGIQLLNYTTTDEYDLLGHLYGTHQLSFSKSLTNTDGEVITETNEEINIKYKELTDNDEIINTFFNDNEIKWNVETVNDNGLLYIDPIINGDNIPTAYDMDNIMKSLLEDTDITYTLTNKEGEDIRLSYQENEEQTLEEYLQTIKLSNGMVLSLSCCDNLVIKYTITFIGDFNDDGVLSIEDIQTLIDKSLELNQLENITADINKDNNVNILDITHYLNILNNIETPLENGTLSAKLENNNDSVSTGETFSIDYVVSVDDYAINGLEGTLEYDTSKLELSNISITTEGLYGNRNGNKFIYVSNSELKNTEYKILNIQFKAINEGDTTISIKDYKFANGGKELTLNGNDIALNITINASNNNNISNLTVNGQNITLEEGKYDYELTVSSDTEEANIIALLENDSATKVTAGPSTLEYGNNLYTITVTAKNGDVRIYKINIIRENPPEEEEQQEEEIVATPIANNTNYQNNDNEGYVENNTIKEDTTQNLPIDNDDKTDGAKETDKKGNASKVIMIILIILVIAALIYLIFKDDDDEEKKANKDINKFKKDIPNTNHRSDPRNNNNNQHDNHKESKKTNNNPKKER